MGLQDSGTETTTDGQISLSIPIGWTDQNTVPYREKAASLFLRTRNQMTPIETGTQKRNGLYYPSNVGTLFDNNFL